MKIKASKVSTRVHTEVYGGTQGRKVTPDENLQSLLLNPMNRISHCVYLVQDAHTSPTLSIQDSGTKK